MLTAPQIESACGMALQALAVALCVAPGGIRLREAVELYVCGELEAAGLPSREYEQDRQGQLQEGAGMLQRQSEVVIAQLDNLEAGQAGRWARREGVGSGWDDEYLGIQSDVSLVQTP